jgi:hypothetical protein
VSLDPFAGNRTFANVIPHYTEPPELERGEHSTVLTIDPGVEVECVRTDKYTMLERRTSSRSRLEMWGAVASAFSPCCRRALGSRYSGLSSGEWYEYRPQAKANFNPATPRLL